MAVDIDHQFLILNNKNNDDDEEHRKLEEAATLEMKVGEWKQKALQGFPGKVIYKGKGYGRGRFGINTYIPRFESRVLRSETICFGGNHRT